MMVILLVSFVKYKQQVACLEKKIVPCHHHHQHPQSSSSSSSSSSSASIIIIHPMTCTPMSASVQTKCFLRYKRDEQVSALLGTTGEEEEGGEEGRRGRETNTLLLRCKFNKGKSSAPASIGIHNHCHQV